MHYVLTALFTLGCVTLISQLFQTNLGLVNIALIHLIPIMVVSLRGNFFATSFIAIIAIVLFTIYVYEALKKLSKVDQVKLLFSTPFHAPQSLASSNLSGEKEESNKALKFKVANERIAF